MGLLDFLSTPEARMGIGLLAAAGPRADGANAGRRIQEAMQMQDAYGQNQQRAKLLQSQIDENASQAEYRKAQAMQEQAQFEAQQRQQAGIPGLFGGGGMGGAGGGQGGAAGGIPAFDIQGALALGLNPTQISEYAGLQNLNRPKVARTVETRGPDGRPVTMQLDEFGQPVGESLAQWKSPMMVNQGDRTSAIDPTTMQPVGSFGINMSQSERDASARGWAANSLAKQRFEYDQNGGGEFGPGQQSLVKQFGKPPQGYRWKDDGAMEPVPGGPADIKAGELGAKADARKEMAVAAAGNVMDAIKDTKKLVGYTTTGAGSALANVPGTDARDLRSRVDTIKANLGFDRLQQMRESSPTGGALGAIAVQELIALQSTVASLDQGQSPAQLRASLNKIEQHYQKWTDTLKAENEPSKGGASGGLGKEPTDKPKATLMESLPTANASNKGRVIRDTTTGKTLRSNGIQWKEE